MCEHPKQHLLLLLDYPTDDGRALEDAVVAYSKHHDPDVWTVCPWFVNPIPDDTYIYMYTSGGDKGWLEPQAVHTYLRLKVHSYPEQDTVVIEKDKSWMRDIEFYLQTPLPLELDKIVFEYVYSARRYKYPELKHYSEPK